MRLTILPLLAVYHIDAFLTWGGFNKNWAQGIKRRAQMCSKLGRDCNKLCARCICGPKNRKKYSANFKKKLLMK
jgi:hypothetical protein